MGQLAGQAVAVGHVGGQPQFDRHGPYVDVALVVVVAHLIVVVLVAGEEVGRAPVDGAAQGQRCLSYCEVLALQLFRVVRGPPREPRFHHPVVLLLNRRRGVVLVGAGTGDDVDHAPGRVAVLGRERRGRHLDLLDGVQVVGLQRRSRREGRPPLAGACGTPGAGAGLGRGQVVVVQVAQVVVGHAVDQELVLVHARPVNAEAVVGGTVVKAAGREAPVDPWKDPQHVQEAPVRERQALDLLEGDVLVHAGIDRLDLRPLGDDGDLLAHFLGGREFEVHALNAADPDRQGRGSAGIARGLHRDLVGRGAHVRRVVEPVGVGGDNERILDLLRLQDDRRSGDGRPLAVRHVAEHLAGGTLARGRRNYQQQHGQHHGPAHRVRASTARSPGKERAPPDSLVLRARRSHLVEHVLHSLSVPGLRDLEAACTGGRPTPGHRAHFKRLGQGYGQAYPIA